MLVKGTGKYRSSVKVRPVGDQMIDKKMSGLFDIHYFFAAGVINNCRRCLLITINKDFLCCR